MNYINLSHHAASKGSKVRYYTSKRNIDKIFFCLYLLKTLSTVLCDDGECQLVISPSFNQAYNFSCNLISKNQMFMCKSYTGDKDIPYCGPGNCVNFGNGVGYKERYLVFNFGSQNQVLRQDLFLDNIDDCFFDDSRIRTILAIEYLPAKLHLPKHRLLIHRFALAEAQQNFEDALEYVRDEFPNVMDVFFYKQSSVLAIKPTVFAELKNIEYFAVENIPDLRVHTDGFVLGQDFKALTITEFKSFEFITRSVLIKTGCSSSDVGLFFKSNNLDTKSFQPDFVAVDVAGKEGDCPGNDTARMIYLDLTENPIDHLPEPIFKNMLLYPGMKILTDPFDCCTKQNEWLFLTKLNDRVYTECKELPGRAWAFNSTSLKTACDNRRSLPVIVIVIIGVIAASIFLAILSAICWCYVLPKNRNEFLVKNKKSYNLPKDVKSKHESDIVSDRSIFTSSDKNPSVLMTKQSTALTERSSALQSKSKISPPMPPLMSNTHPLSTANLSMLKSSAPSRKSGTSARRSNGRYTCKVCSRKHANQRLASACCTTSGGSRKKVPASRSGLGSKVNAGSTS